MVVTDPERRRALGDIYRRAWKRYRAEGVLGGAPRRDPDPASATSSGASAAPPATWPSTWARCRCT